ncbi:RagB/SusD family nutrient uptake outer membrane protein [Tannerella sp.]|uniref:RagB/SusD family nutrient uptake outer membrane protein n=1 Tax=Tannerella sp. TaxID=2382127 RepID=UPI0026DB996C|nr:RagB/SusD family nutrient uptake outer membrane protein [Tannerella sp.]MDO4702528.1 RagB/SusD family nutrient uptake outer membrane protein [Tannerella sp.]
MKKIALNIIVIISAVLSSSCSHNWLDLEPTDGVPSHTAIADVEGLKVARIGMYDGLQGNSTYNEYYAARMIYYGDVRGDDMQARAAGKRTSALYEMKYRANDAPKMWNVPYHVLRRANNIIKAVEGNEVKSSDKDKPTIRSVYGEALVVRALVHFDLVRVYGQTYTADNGASLGIPIMTKPVGSKELPTRNTVKEVYDQVISDLKKAIDEGALPQKTKTPGYINHWTAKALLSRVYLYMGDNTNALKEAEDVINNSPYKLWSNAEYAANVWDKTSGAHGNEMLLEILNVSTDDYTDREGIAYLYNEDGYDDAIATKAFCDLLQADPNDVRLTAMLASKDNGLKKVYKDDKVWVNKYPANSTGEMRLSNVPILRLSEMYLNAAEAAAKLGNKEAAAKYLNAIVLRANPDATPVADATLKRILTERRKEFIGEGHRFFDAMRNNETIVRYEDDANIGYHYPLAVNESKKFDRTYFRVILPIPIDEVDVNPEIKKQQNPGY